MKIVFALALLLLPACAQMGPTAEQLKAMEGTSSSLCVNSPGWNGSPVSVHYSSFGGKSTGTGGGGGSAKCGTSEVTFANEGRAAPQTITTTTKVTP